MFYAFEYERQQYPHSGYVKKSLRFGGYKNKEYAIQALDKACKKHNTTGEVLEYGYPCKIIHAVTKDHMWTKE